MSYYDANQVYTVKVHDNVVPPPESASENERHFLEFLQQYRVGGEYIYRSDHLSLTRKQL
jgi:DNA replication licensing factor MCM5